MPPFPKPSFSFPYQADVEIKALRHYRDTKPGQAIPKKTSTTLLVATWNIANLGVQERRAEDYQLIAEMLTRFDLIAVARYIKLPEITQQFDGFDRTPYLASFQPGSFQFLLVNVRRLETFAVARWADNRRRSANCYCKDIIVLGDFNLPKAAPGDPIYDALTQRGLHLPQHTSEVGSNLSSDNHYDQIGFFPGETPNDFTGQSGVFDFDGAAFSQLHATRPLQDFLAYVRYYLSDHRIMWAEFKAQQG